MKKKELQEKQEGELQKLLKSARENLRELHFKVANDQMKNVREIRKAKKTIARILTILKQRQLKKSTGKE